MAEWKAFEPESVLDEGTYLVSDGKYVEVADFRDYDKSSPVWYLPEVSFIDGRNAITHYAAIELPNTNIKHIVAGAITESADYIDELEKENKRLKENISVALYELDLLKKNIDPSERSFISRHFDQIANWLKDE